MSKRRRFVLVGILIGMVISVAVVYSWPRKPQKLSQCFLNLSEINWCKTCWASDEHKTTNDTPTWNDLSDYLQRHGFTNGIPVCPQGGTYTLGRIGEPPRCSIGGPDHSYVMDQGKLVKGTTGK